MTQFEQEQSAKKFVEFWKHKGDDQEECITLLLKIFIR